MKVQVHVTTSSKINDSIPPITLVVGPSETVATFKDRVSEVQLIPFPEQDLQFDGKVLENLERLADCGIEDDSALNLTVKATDATLVHQFSELLQARNLSVDELGLLYCYKHGANISQALKCLGFEGSLENFIAKEKSISMKNSYVSLSSFTKEDGDSPPRPASPEEMAPQGLGNDSSPPFSEDGLGSTADLDTIDVEQFTELHEAIYSKSFNSKIVKSLNDLVAAISETSFMDIDHVVTGGAVGKGVAISGAAHAEIVLFVRGLPAVGHESWLAPLLTAVCAILVSQMDKLGIDDVQTADDSVKIKMRPASSNVTASLFITPTFDSYAETLQCLWQQENDTLRFYSPALAKERTQFISRQPSAVRTTIRLMKWWRDQQQWSSQITRPSDEILELAVVYSAVQTKPADQKVAIANVMSLLSKFNKLRVVWSNFYTKDDIPGHMLRKRPLLMDPTNPFVNVAAKDTFQSAELMEKANKTHFFW